MGVEISNPEAGNKRKDLSGQLFYSTVMIPFMIVQ